jgi:hypothetical protein
MSPKNDAVLSWAIAPSGTVYSSLIASHTSSQPSRLSSTRSTVPTAYPASHTSCPCLRFAPQRKRVYSGYVSLNRPLRDSQSVPRTPMISATVTNTPTSTSLRRFMT